MALKSPPPYVKGHNLIEGKSVLITAAAGAGIGFAAAKRAAEEGARGIVVSDIHQGRLIKSVEALKAETGLDAIYPKLCNVTIESDVQELVDYAEEVLQGVDVDSGLRGVRVCTLQTSGRDDNIALRIVVYKANSDRLAVSTGGVSRWMRPPANLTPRVREPLPSLSPKGVILTSPQHPM